MATRPPPAARSASCNALTSSRWAASAPRIASGSTVTRSLAPFPRRITISPRPKIDILDPESHRLVEPEAGAVEQGAEQTVGARELVQHRADLGAAQHHRKAGRGPGAKDGAEFPERAAEDLAIEKEQRAQRLALGGGRHPVGGGELGEKAGHVDLAQLAGVAEAVEPDVAANPGHICCLGSGTVVGGAQGLAKAHHEFGRCGRERWASEHMTDIAEEGREGKGEKARAAAPYRPRPNPAGARARPTAPVSAASASRYGITRKS
jgi:hypothetical protein